MGVAWAYPLATCAICATNLLIKRRAGVRAGRAVISSIRLRTMLYPILLPFTATGREQDVASVDARSSASALYRRDA